MTRFLLLLARRIAHACLLAVFVLIGILVGTQATDPSPGGEPVRCVNPAPGVCP